MSTQKLKDLPATVIQDLEQFIEVFHHFKLSIENNQLLIKITANASEAELLSLLDYLWNNGFEICFHDTVYPQLTDPGAHFSYSSEQSPNSDIWSMTLGNHGWSGGIYLIRKTTLAKQISNLVSKSNISGIQITDAAFFAHYAIEPTEKSEAKDKELLNMHS